MLDRSLKLAARAVQPADQMMRYAQKRMAYFDGVRMRHRGRHGAAAFCVEQAGFVISHAQVEHVQRRQQPYLVERVIARLRNRQAFQQCRMRRFAHAAREH